MSGKVYKYQIRITKKFKKSVKRATKRGKRIQKLKDIVEMLAKGEEISSAYKDHALTGN